MSYFIPLSVIGYKNEKNNKYRCDEKIMQKSVTEQRISITGNFITL